jgi:hypothetical protein
LSAKNFPRKQKIKLKEVEMKRIVSLAILILFSLALSGISGQATEKPRGAENFAEIQSNLSGEQKPVTLELKAVPVLDALRILTEKADISYAIKGELPETLKVTVSLKNANPWTAMNLVCEAANLTCAPANGGGWVIYATPTVSVSGVKVPVVGAVSLHDFSSTGPAIVSSQTPESRAFKGDDQLVDLQVKDLPISEALRLLFRQAEFGFILDPALSQDLRVTASMKKVPLREALLAVLNQANLHYIVYDPLSLIVIGPRLPGSSSTSPTSSIKVVIPELPKCPKCGADLFPGWKFCPNDGSKITAGK